MPRGHPPPNAIRVSGPVNIGSEEMISIHGLAQLIIRISGKSLHIRCVDGPEGVRGRTSDNRLIERELGWKPTGTLARGIEQLYAWVVLQVAAAREMAPATKPKVA